MHASAARKRRALAAGIDPAAQRKVERAGLENTFEAIALEWLGKQQFATATREKAEWTFRELLFPHIGSRPIATISPPELLGVLRRIEVRGRLETCHRTKQRAGQVFRYATLLNELGYSSDVIELQMAHKERNKVRAAYNRAQRLDERRKMMQGWSDHLDSLRDGAKVFRLRRAG